MTPPVNGALAKTVGQLGATGALIVISLWLVWAATQPVEPNQEAQAATERVRAEIFRDFTEIKAQLDVHIQQSTRGTDALKAILRQICVNTSDDSSQRTACFTRVE